MLYLRNYYYYYSDPNSLATVGHFHDSIQWALNGTFTQQDIDEAKLSVFSQVGAVTGGLSLY